MGGITRGLGKLLLLVFLLNLSTAGPWERKKIGGGVFVLYAASWNILIVSVAWWSKKTTGRFKSYSYYHIPEVLQTKTVSTAEYMYWWGKRMNEEKQNGVHLMMWFCSNNQYDCDDAFTHSSCWVERRRNALMNLWVQQVMRCLSWSG